MTTTESASSRFAALEDYSSLDMVEAILEGQFAAIAAVHAARDVLAEAIDKSAERIARGGRLFYIGAGTSGRIATQDAAELPPTFNWPPERAISLMAGGENAFIEAVEGAEDSETEAPAALDANGLTADDVVIGIAASGRTPFTIAGLAHARANGALTIGIYNNKGGKVGSASEIDILIDTGAELLAGSTRMKAGTAQKVALNCISTGVMVKLGFVYRGLMVEMRPSNEKLRGRAADIVSALTGADTATATDTLKATDWSIKLATVMLTKNIAQDEAGARLAGADGNLRKALQ
jgi:N-acetylmuramic acid 6-phosphate etherase